MKYIVDIDNLKHKITFIALVKNYDDSAGDPIIVNDWENLFYHPSFVGEDEKLYRTYRNLKEGREWIEAVFTYLESKIC